MDNSREYYFNKLESIFNQIDANCNNVLLIDELIHFAKRFKYAIEYEYSAFYVAYYDYDVEGLGIRYYYILGKTTVDEAHRRLDDLIRDDNHALNSNIKEISQKEYNKFNHLAHLEAVIDRLEEIKRCNYDNVDHEIDDISEKIDILKKELGLNNWERVIFD